MRAKRPTGTITKKQARFSAGLLGAYVLVTLCALGFVRLAWEVRERETLGFDEAVLTAINHASTPFLNSFMPIATDVGGFVGVTLLTVVLLGLFIAKNEYRRALLVVVSVAGAALLNIVLKLVFARDRPDLWEQLVHEAGYSFPSGHAMASAALGLALAVALWNSRWRWWGLVFAVVYIAFVGYSRLYLGVHYPTDILAGWLVSGVWVLAIALLIRSKLGHQALRNLP
ncbi:MAG: phosphatase PAP2 family protein [Candidatus Saccharibacteria bacterium]|nr:phosphatase PAP2 family protein [Candidatus Saccharibacteria bacterium]MCA9336810.1 phosphatase PAP2 family protein [Candidatus Saccharibacteria bacterium]MCA9339897.1 phosphatase PAP2 family protein [Candidatus Saccharibacteria bacterium]